MRDGAAGRVESTSFGESVSVVAEAESSLSVVALSREVSDFCGEAAVAWLPDR